MKNSFGALKNLEAMLNENLPHILSGTEVLSCVSGLCCNPI